MSTNETAVSAGESLRKLIGPLMAVIVGMFMVILDSTVVNVALPGLVKDFDTTLKTMQWSITGYTLALSAVIPIAGWMTDRFGAKRIFLFTIGFFTLGSVLCSMATSPEQLILFRVIQGIGGGMVAPIGMAVIFRLAPQDKMGSVMGMLGVPMLLAPALGPVLSGWLIEYASWHWIFLINLPVGIVAILIGLRKLPNFERKSVPSLDIKGIILAPIAFSMLAYGVNEGGSSWSSPQALIGLIVGGVALLLFILVEVNQKQPLLELRVFKSSDFTRGIIIAWVMQIALFGAIVLLPMFLQSVRGYSSLETGLILLPQALASATMMPIGGRLFDRLGARPLVLTGVSFITTSLLLLSRIQTDTSLGYIMVSLALLGGGMGLSMMSINTHVLKAAPKHLVSRVTPLTTAAQQVMTSFAVAGLTGFLTSHATSNIKDNGGDVLTGTVAAYGDTFLLAAGIAVIGILLGTILRKPKQLPESGPEGGESVNPVMMAGH